MQPTIFGVLYPAFAGKTCCPDAVCLRSALVLSVRIRFVLFCFVLFCFVLCFFVRILPCFVYYLNYFSEHLVPSRLGILSMKRALALVPRVAPFCLICRVHTVTAFCVFCYLVFYIVYSISFSLLLFLAFSLLHLVRFACLCMLHCSYSVRSALEGQVSTL